jgi:hypothetical protein
VTFIILDFSTNLRGELILRVFKQDILVFRSELQSCGISFRSDEYLMPSGRRNGLNVRILMNLREELILRALRARYFNSTVKIEMQNENLCPKTRKFRESRALYL